METSTQNLANNMKVLQVIKPHTSDINCIEFWGDSLLFTGSSDKTIRVFSWVPGSGFKEQDFSPLLGHKYSVTSLRVSPQGGVLASASVDGNVFLWDIRNGYQMNKLTQQAGEAVRGCAFSPNGNFIVSSDDTGAVSLFNQDKNLIKNFKCHEESIHSIAFSSDSKVLITGCTLGNIRLFLIDNVIDNRLVMPCCSIDNAHDLGVLSLDFNRLVQNDPADCNTSIYTVATCGTDHLIKIWKIYGIQNLKDSKINKSRLVPQTEQEHFSGTSTIHCTESMNAECVLTIPAHGSSVTCVRFNSTGTIFVSCSLDKTIKLWDLQGTCLKTVSEHTRYVNCVAINLTTTLIASGSNDKSVIIWDLSNVFDLNSILPKARPFICKFIETLADTPIEFICPITMEVMKNPVTAKDGFTYESTAINEWFKNGKHTSPMTNIQLNDITLTENLLLKEKIKKFFEYLFE